MAVAEFHVKKCLLLILFTLVKESNPGERYIVRGLALTARAQCLVWQSVKSFGVRVYKLELAPQLPHKSRRKFQLIILLPETPLAFVDFYEVKHINKSWNIFPQVQN